jgi:hypothetical protein
MMMSSGAIRVQTTFVYLQYITHMAPLAYGDLHVQCMHA